MLLENAVVVVFLCVCDKIAQPVNAIGGYILSITVTVIHLFLCQRISTALGLPLRLAYSDRGLMTCPGAYVTS